MLRGFVLCRLVRFDGVGIESSRDGFTVALLSIYVIVLLSLVGMEGFVRTDMLLID